MVREESENIKLGVQSLILLSYQSDGVQGVNSKQRNFILNSSPPKLYHHLYMLKLRRVAVSFSFFHFGSHEKEEHVAKSFSSPRVGRNPLHNPIYRDWA